MFLRQCRCCGQFFEASVPMMRYCSLECMRKGKNQLTQKYRRLKEEQSSHDHMLSDTSVVYVDGQHRIKAAVVLEKLMKKEKAK